MKTIPLIVSILLLITNAYQSDCAKILGIFPTSAKSHSIVSTSLMKGLAKKGHEVTVISSFPLKKPMENYRDIELTGLTELLEDELGDLLEFTKLNPLQAVAKTYKFGHLCVNHTLSHPSVQQFLASSNETFDLIVLEIFMDDALLGFAHHFNAPVVGLSTFGACKWTTDLIGTPSPPSFVPNPFLSLTDRMSFFERIANTLMNTIEMIAVNYLNLPVQKELYARGFKDPKPKLDDLRQNAVSLVLLNNHFSLSTPRPYLPNMIEVGGMHINRVKKELPEDIKAILDNAKNGAIFFSLGSNIKSKMMPIEKRDMFLKLFRGLDLTVLWKWEDDHLPGQPENVIIKSWWPQDDILDHPNIRLFITHGGLLSTTESIYHGKPVLGIPIFGDQDLNMAKAVRGGYGLKISYKELSYEKLKERVDSLLSEDSFTTNAKLASERYRDQQNTPLDTAIYWVEYVIRHKGANHLKSGSQELSFLQYHNIDVFAVLILTPILVICMLIKLLLRCIKKGKGGGRKIKKN